MDFKNVRNIIGASVGSFIVIMIAMYFLYPQINPEEQVMEPDDGEMETSGFDTETNEPKAVESLNEQIKILQDTVDSMRVLEKNYKDRVDSLNEHIVQIQQEKADLQAEEPEEITAEDLKNISRSLLDMDEEALKPILQQLEDNQLIGLYNSANNMQRGKLLRSLDSDKAATILKKLM